MTYKEKKIDWIIHFCANHACDICGEEETHFLPYTCNAHTHGMEKYGHPDFQVVLLLPTQEIAYLLNIMGIRVQEGEVFHPGDLVSDIYADCEIRLDEYEEMGRNVLRLIIPDRENRFPEHPHCMDIYKLQLLPTKALCMEGGEIS